MEYAGSEDVLTFAEILFITVVPIEHQTATASRITFFWLLEGHHDASHGRREGELRGLVPRMK